jgi:subfamily B ATP-binding cassette protein MsbA
VTSRRSRARRRTVDAPKASLREVGRLADLIRYVRPYRGWLAFAMVGVMVSAALGLVFPAIMGDLVDSALGTGSDVGTLDQVALVLLGVFALQAAFNALRVYALDVVGEGVVADLRTEVYDRIVRLPVPFFDARRTGEITSRLTSDAAVVQTTVSSSLAQALSQAITLVGGIVLLVVLSPVLSLTVLALLPVVIVAATVFGRRLQRVSTAFQDGVAEANALAEESIASIPVVKWFTAEEAMSARYAAAIRDAYGTALRRARIRAVFIPIVTFAAFGTLSLVLWVGGRQVLEGTLTIGELVSFLLYTLVVAGAIGSFTGLYSELQEALGASKRIFELLGEPVELPSGAEAEEPAERVGAINYDGVDFRYPGRDMAVLSGVELDVAPGETVALVGPSGAGKSTMTALLARFHDATAGTVRVDGVDVRHQDLRALRAEMAAVPQEVQLFSGTIADNLRVAKPEAGPDDLERAARAANAHDFIVGFPDGYDTVVGERGVQLSGGQRQRVAIARAVLADPKILVLDEATSSLDAESESLVQEALERLMEGRTTIVIAHRLSTVLSADRIVVLAAGRVVESGTHAELMALGGLYAELSERQLVTEA